MTRIFISLTLVGALLGACDVPPEDLPATETKTQAQDSGDYPQPSPERAQCYASCLSSYETCKANPGQYPGVDCYEKYLDCVADYCDEVVPIIKPTIQVVAPVKPIFAAP